jgi:arylsulfatase
MRAELIEMVTQRPNVILILVHDMGFSDLGIMGSEIQTPNIDRIA